MLFVARHASHPFPLCLSQLFLLLSQLSLFLAFLPRPLELNWRVQETRHAMVAILRLTLEDCKRQRLAAVLLLRKDWKLRLEQLSRRRHGVSKPGPLHLVPWRRRARSAEGSGAPNGGVSAAATSSKSLRARASPLPRGHSPCGSAVLSRRYTSTSTPHPRPRDTAETLLLPKAFWQQRLSEQWRRVVARSQGRRTGGEPRAWTEAEDGQSWERDMERCRTGAAHNGRYRNALLVKLTGHMVSRNGCEGACTKSGIGMTPCT
eukprot:scaffold447_cov307-Pinguiococcus_pyrenoidosus.AAC.67